MRNALIDSRKTARFGRKTGGVHADASSFAEKSRALFLACVVFGILLGAGLTVLEHPELRHATVWQEILADAGREWRAAGTSVQNFGRENSEKLAQIRLPDMALVTEKIAASYQPVFAGVSYGLWQTVQKMGKFQQDVISYAATQNFSFSVTTKKQDVKQIAAMVAEPVIVEAPLSEGKEIKLSLQKVMEDLEKFSEIAPASGDVALEENLSSVTESVEKQMVQSVLIARRQAVISSLMNGKILELPFQNGDVFSKEDVLVKFDCAVEAALAEEKGAALRFAEAELKAKKQLHKLGELSEIEYVAARESTAQEKARLEQVIERMRQCEIKAPFDGRITNRVASPYEYAERGRVLMEISANEPLLLQFLVPSVWLRWMNIGTPFEVYVEESGKTYDAKVIRVHGKIDPVSQTAEIVAEMSEYAEELLPGMGGKAIFDVVSARKTVPLGFIGLKIAEGPADTTRDAGDE